ncbi:hypothetical protein PHLGIDRAFT_32714 [Phlebiopsis gigantea 11061_1 CR5-6]|uniref:WD40 repeat-like protein n=1 Tax=Phlebiopsis gigantea (strain 11061_1 CR5-6) TaxID=745531 RepID=A0A0C3S873_PHLG1|nr:hypothetical protein PHLGIDRAFT_32714 [Phlebiopsis gigantea 11061_1 CR5-6]
MPTNSDPSSVGTSGRPPSYPRPVDHVAEKVDIPTMLFVKAATPWMQTITTPQQVREDIRNLKPRQLGSSVGILTASSRLRERLGRVLFLFRENAEDLFPQLKAKRKKGEVAVFRRLNKRTYHRAQAAGNVRGTEPRANDSPTQERRLLGFPVADGQGHSGPVNRKHLPLEMQAFSLDIATLLECFSQYPDFVDEIPDQSLGKELTDWAQSLNDFEDDFSAHAVQKFIYDSMVDVGSRLDLIATKFIPTFMEIGIPTVRFSQKHATTNFQNLSTVAALFSGVTATMLQFSWNVTDTHLSIAVNVFWFISLVFSISSTVNSLLGLSWTQAIYRSPDHRLPWIVSICITRTPLIFLVLSVACFFVGLIVFCYSSKQAEVTSVMTTVLASLSCLGLVIMSFWFACEMWVYRRYDGHMWLADVLSSFKDDAKTSLASVWAAVQPYQVWQESKKHLSRSDHGQDVEKIADVTDHVGAIGQGYREELYDRLFEDSKNVPFWLTCDKSLMSASEIARHRWHEAMRQLALRIREQQAPPAYDSHHTRPLHDGVPDIRGMLPNLRASHLIPKLRQMAITQELHSDDRHEALVRFLRFSPNGNFLVTSSWDRTSHIVNINKSLNCERTITHPYGRGFVHQLEWAPTGNRLLMRRNRSITLWDTDGKRLLDLPRGPNDPDYRTVAWFGTSGESWLFVGGSTVFIMDVQGGELDKHHIENLLVRDVAVTDDSKWMLCIGKYHHDDDKAFKKKHQIVLYDLVKFSIVKRYPVFHEMCDITLAEDNKSVLVSYENRAPPQLWELHASHKRGAPPAVILRHTYMPKVPTAFAGFPATFGGPQDELILRVGSAGNIYVWDRYSANLLSQITAPASLGNLTAFTWNRGPGAWMFATGTHEGGVHIWTIPSEEKPALVISEPKILSAQEGQAIQTSPEMDTASTPDGIRSDESVESPVAERGEASFHRRGSEGSMGSGFSSDDDTVMYEDREYSQTGN